VKIPSGLAEFRALVLAWDGLNESDRQILLNGIADQLDPLEFFMLEVEGGIAEKFQRMSPALQFSYWLYQTDIDLYGWARTACINRIRRENIERMRGAAGAFGPGSEEGN
jgi:hypothetical protein